VNAAWEKFTLAAARHVLKPETRQAICGLAAMRLAGPAPNFDIATISASSRVVGARLAPVAAAFGWLPAYGTRNGWVNMAKPRAGVGMLSISDPETIVCFAIFRGSGVPILSALAIDQFGHMECVTGNQPAFRARQQQAEKEARKRRKSTAADEARLAKLRELAPKSEAAIRAGTWTPASEEDWCDEEE
jgi:hypothetical protein